MADISIHNVKNVIIDKYPLTNTFVCRIIITSESRIDKIEFTETITLFSDNEETYNNLRNLEI